MRRLGIPVVVVLLAVALGGCGGEARPVAKVLPRISSTEVAVGRLIRLTATGPVPHHLIAGPGDTVTWRNDTAAVASVALIDGSRPSGPIRPGGLYQHSFPDSGTFAYRLGTVKTISGYVEINLPAPTPSQSRLF